MRRDDRQKPPRPTSTALSRVLDYLAWGARKARRAIMARMKAGGGEQLIVPMEVFWREAEKGAPAIAFSVNGRDGVISVPPDGGLMLQVYRAANNPTRTWEKRNAGAAPTLRPVSTLRGASTPARCCTSRCSTSCTARRF